MEAGLSDDVDFDSGIPPRIIDITGLDLGDGHNCDVLRVQELAMKGEFKQRNGNENLIN